ncbi:MAG: response regulator [Hyphomicrobiales bacterium]|nr:response regulator [Hyphomicrobiales bacterium]
MARILIVEDEPLISAVLEDWLSDLGHQVVGPACSVKQALSVITNASFDAAILDVNLGGERCDLLVDVLLACGAPFAFTTGDATDTVDKRFKSLTVTKPYDFETIERLIASLLNMNDIEIGENRNSLMLPSLT